VRKLPGPVRGRNRARELDLWGSRPQEAAAGMCTAGWRRSAGDHRQVGRRVERRGDRAGEGVLAGVSGSPGAVLATDPHVQVGVRTGRRAAAPESSTITVAVDGGKVEPGVGLPCHGALVPRHRDGDRVGIGALPARLLVQHRLTHDRRPGRRVVLPGVAGQPDGQLARSGCRGPHRGRGDGGAIGGGEGAAGRVAGAAQAASDTRTRANARPSRPPGAR